MKTTELVRKIESGELNAVFAFLSIWHDIPESFPLPRCKWQTAYCVLLISVRFMVIVTVVNPVLLPEASVWSLRYSFSLWAF